MTSDQIQENDAAGQAGVGRQQPNGQLTYGLALPADVKPNAGGGGHGEGPMEGKDLT